MFNSPVVAMFVGKKCLIPKTKGKFGTFLLTQWVLRTNCLFSASQETQNQKEKVLKDL